MGLIRASSANQSGGDEEGSNGGRGGIINGNGTGNAIVVVNSGVVNHAKGDQKPLRHNPGIKPWTQEELDILEEELAKNSNEPLLTRYTNISLLFSNKTVRDVVLFCKWRAERIAERNAQQLASPAISEDNDDDDSNEAIGDAKGLLLEKNLQLFDQISTCFETSQFQENINLLSQIRNNILTVMTDFHEMPNKHLPQLPPLPVKQLPPLPVKLNEELANLVLPKKIS